MLCDTVFFLGYGDHRYLHVLTHAFPTLRSSYLIAGSAEIGRQGPHLFCFRPTGGRRRGSHPAPQYIAQGKASRPDPRPTRRGDPICRSEEHTSELQSLMRISYAVFCLKKKNQQPTKHTQPQLLQSLNPDATY